MNHPAQAQGEGERRKQASVCQTREAEANAEIALLKKPYSKGAWQRWRCDAGSRKGMRDATIVWDARAWTPCRAL